MLGGGVGFDCHSMSCVKINSNHANTHTHTHTQTDTVTDTNFNISKGEIEYVDKVRRDRNTMEKLW